MPTDLTPLVVATTNLGTARRAHAWFRNRSILSKITRDGVTTIEVCVPHPSPSGEGPDQEELIETTRVALVGLLPGNSEVKVIRGPAPQVLDIVHIHDILQYATASSQLTGIVLSEEAKTSARLMVQAIAEGRVQVTKRVP